MEQRNFEELVEYTRCVRCLDDLHKQRRLALAGTLGSIALIATNITGSTELLMTGTVIFPSLLEYLSYVGSKTNQKQLLKNSFINGETKTIGEDIIEVEYNINEEIEYYPGYTIIDKNQQEDKIVVTYANRHYVFLPKGNENDFGKPLYKLTKKLKQTKGK